MTDKKTLTHHRQTLKSPELYLNRELSVLQFNRRVLDLASTDSTPLLERLNFLTIVSSNLDEFYEIRVAHLKHHDTLGIQVPSPDNLSNAQLLQKISQEAHALVAEQYSILNHMLLPLLEARDIRFIPQAQWSYQQAMWIKQYFTNEILPLLSPVALDVAHPFPRLVNKSLNFIVQLSGEDAFGRDGDLAIVHAPRSLPRIVRIPDEYCHSGENFVYLSSIVNAHIAELFPGMQVDSCYQFRITRNSDLALHEDDVEDLPNALKSELQAQRYGHAVRLEIMADCPSEISSYLLSKHELVPEDLFRVNGQVNLNRYQILNQLLDNTDLKYPSFTPNVAKRLQQNNIFNFIRQKDILLHHPFDSFGPIVDMIHQAARDPDVMAIKTILYRTGPHSPMVHALVEAARAGKEVTAVIELRARFDEAQNIELANRLHEAGALVVYGVIGFKTHAKMTLIVRYSGKVLERYAHLGTGNYHSGTAKQYTDYGLLTYNKEITADVQNIFQQLTGMSKMLKLKKLLHSPFTLHKKLLHLIEAEIEQAIKGNPAHIMIKVNGLTEGKLIRALYQASQSGVKIDLIVRGICALRPGVAGISDNIQVHSIIGRFLEHSRIFYFLHAGAEKIWLSSADWMDRNMFRRIEVCFPIEDRALAERIKKDSLLLYLQDNCQRWALQSDGSYKKVLVQHGPKICAQQILLDQLK